MASGTPHGHPRLRRRTISHRFSVAAVRSQPCFLFMLQGHGSEVPPRTVCSLNNSTMCQSKYCVVFLWFGSRSPQICARNDERAVLVMSLRARRVVMVPCIFLYSPVLSRCWPRTWTAQVQAPKCLCNFPRHQVRVFFRWRWVGKRA